MNILCNSCLRTSEAEAYPSINASTRPELKEKLLSGELFLWECPHCGERQLIKYPLVYIDPAEHILICLSSVPLAIEDLQGNTGRLVGEVGELIEKIKIFDAGLDDVAIEMCKWVTSQEMNGGMDLKFLSFNGADNELVFTYPDKGEMQMLAVGFNVYEDCLGVIQRTPSLSEAASKGLVKVDRRWLKDFIG